MIDGLRSLPDVWRKMQSEHHARVPFEGLIGRRPRLPHCGSVRPTVLITADLDGQAWAVVVPDKAGATLPELRCA